MARMILAGDIGGSKTLVALFDGGTRRFERRYASGEFACFGDLLERTFADASAAVGIRPAIERACFGVAGPVIGDHVDFTNLPWTLDASHLAKHFAIEQVRLINDLAASAHGLDALTADDIATLQAGTRFDGGTRVLAAAGTGLGIAYVFHDGTHYRVLASEGGHAGFAPADRSQAALWASLYARTGRVEVEHVISGPGLERIYAHLRELGAAAASPQLEREIAGGDGAAAIARFALEGQDPLANAALDLFVSCYGALAGDHALNVVAQGGVYVAGGIAPKILGRLAAGGFIDAFNAKGAFSDLARSMPVHVVLNERLGLLGAARVAAMP